MKAENAVSSSQQKKTLVRVSGQLLTNRVRFSVRIRVGSTIFLRGNYARTASKI